MIKILKSFLFIALVTVQGSLSAQETVKRDLGNFTAVSVSGKIRTELYKSDTSGLFIQTNGTTPEYVITQNDGRELSIRLKTDTPKDAEILVKIYYTGLEALTVQAQSLITSPEVISGDRMEFESRSGGKMELKLSLNSLNAEVKQGGILVFTGTTGKQDIMVNTGGTYSGYELDSGETYVRASSGGKAKVTAGKIIDATANAKGFVGYRGEPVSTTVKTSLGGEISHLTGDSQE